MEKNLLCQPENLLLQIDVLGLEDLRPYISDEMKCEIYRFAVNLLLERVKREGNFPCYKDIECAVMRAAEVYEVVNKKLGKLKL